MSAPDRITDPERYTIELLHDEASGTVTFAASPRGESTVSPTRWITVATDDLVDVGDPPDVDG